MTLTWMRDQMDVIDLRDFYGRSLGKIAQRVVRARIAEFWPSVQGLRVAGLGYATPYLRPFLGDAERVIALMPAPQGVHHWPYDQRSLVSLVHEDQLPLADESIDRMLLVHAVEDSESLRAMLRQVWRVMAPGGRVLIVAPNRVGIWARRETTPFAHGRPYSRTQLTSVLRDAMFSPTDWRSALYMPPFEWRPFMRTAGTWEKAGQMLGQRFAGVILVEAVKQIYAAPPQLPEGHLVRAREAVRGLVPKTQRQNSRPHSDPAD